MRRVRILSSFEVEGMEWSIGLFLFIEVGAELVRFFGEVAFSG